MRFSRAITLGLSIVPSVYSLPAPGDKAVRLIEESRCGPTKTERYGDGDPHQNYYHMQVSDVLDCTNGQCGVTRSHEFSIGYSVSVNVGDWISGGFGVEKTYTEAKEYQCQGQPGESVCVWVSLAHTAYTVSDVQRGLGTDCERVGPLSVMRSPNSGFKGSHYYCVRNNCRNEGDGYWQTAYAPKGGPGPTDLGH
ncbi:hypothetical protein PRK78_006750 [Emydomyces testavorans]|uniref:Secreted protein n=1 Tax=Emydomyces testavorans TaxID=2070801 RepID=A0AAF0DLY0_9EURO|nr:hypothetical protein PRK78_006750 [Emydomyces testavorans]